MMAKSSPLCVSYLGSAAREESHQMQLVSIIQGQLIEDSTNSVAWYICLNPDMTYRIKVVENWSLKEHLP